MTIRLRPEDKAELAKMPPPVDSGKEKQSRTGPPGKNAPLTERRKRKLVSILHVVGLFQKRCLSETGHLATIADISHYIGFNKLEITEALRWAQTNPPPIEDHIEKVDAVMSIQNLDDHIDAITLIRERIVKIVASNQRVTAGSLAKLSIGLAKLADSLVRCQLTRTLTIRALTQAEKQRVVRAMEAQQTEDADMLGDILTDDSFNNETILLGNTTSEKEKVA